MAPMAALVATLGAAVLWVPLGAALGDIVGDALSATLGDAFEDA